jgi:zinc and cadmium transporter
VTEFLVILGSGLLMSVVALVGSVTLLLSEATLRRILRPIVGLAGGSLMGGALFHMLPEGVAALGNGPRVYIWVAVGFLMFMLLEQVLDWHHCHRPPSEHRATLSWLLLIADGLHNFLGGLAVGGAFMLDLRVGAIAWLAAVAHEVPQELGDFGVLVHGGWSARRALLYNAMSALTFPLGGLLAWALSSSVDVAVLLPLGAGNFLYIAASDLVPEVKGRREDGKTNLGGLIGFVVGLALLLAIRLAFAGMA